MIIQPKQTETDQYYLAETICPITGKTLLAEAPTRGEAMSKCFEMLLSSIDRKGRERRRHVNRPPLKLV